MSASHTMTANLLKGAVRIEILPPVAVRDEGYERVGRWVVEHSDVTLALWDGAVSRGRGDTAATVAYARDRGLPIYLIRTNVEAPAVKEL